MTLRPLAPRGRPVGIVAIALLLAIPALVAPSAAYANVRVSGRIVDELGNPLAGFGVDGATTDREGRFVVVTRPEARRLAFRYPNPYRTGPEISLPAEFDAPVSGDLGNLVLPSLESATVAVLDDQGDLVPDASVVANSAPHASFGDVKPAANARFLAPSYSAGGSTGTSGMVKIPRFTGVPLEPSSGSVTFTEGPGAVFVGDLAKAVVKDSATLEVSVPGLDVPGAPSHLAAQAEDRAVVLSWTAPKDEVVSGYDVFDENGKQIGAVDPAATSFRASNLDNGRSYSFSVRAGTQRGKSAQSVATSPMLEGSPGPPESSYVSAGDRSLRMTWTAPRYTGSPLLGYTVACTTSSDPDGGRTVSVGPDDLTVTVDQLKNGSPYACFVSAINSVGTGSPIRAVGYAQPAGAPQPPALTASRADKAVVLRWTPADDNGSPVTGYRIRDARGVETIVSSRTRTFEFTGLRNGQRYSYSIAAVNRVGQGAMSDARSVIPAGVPGAPARPRAVAGKRSVTISWKAPSANGTPITHYDIQPMNGQVRTVRGTARSFKWTGLKKGKKYSFRVHARNAVGLSKLSSASVIVKVK